MKGANFFKRAGQIFYVNLLWLVCSLGIFTAGSATCAAFYVFLKIVNWEECNITKTFFKGFKDNFKQGSLMWIVSVVTLGVSGYFWYLIRRAGDCGLGPKIGAGAYTLISVILNIYAYPLIARYTNSFKRTLQNALILSVQYLYGTIMMIVFIGLEVFICNLNGYVKLASIFFLPALIVFTVSLTVRQTFNAVEQL